ncbi:MAG TPA: hypothetical protein VFP09_08995, partial [Desertimonas sp.]|nr:hypothetical protein [Desertimonas sp.]
MDQPLRRLERRREQAKDRFGVLLVLLIGSFVALGFDNTLGRYVAGVLQVTALGVGFLATSLHRDHRWLGLLSLVAAGSIVTVAIEGDVASGIAEVAGVVILGVLLVAVLERVLRHEHVTMQTLFGAVCAYFLIGL